MHAPTYLRMIVNARCSLGCTYCHREGDPRQGQGRGVALPALIELGLAGVDAGVRKLKLLGGEPLLRADLPALIRALRAADSGLDLSVITGGGVPTERVDAAFAAGLSRMNLSVHGWRLPDFVRKAQRGEALWALRQRNVERLLQLGRPIKLNYVYTGPSDRDDLQALLDWATERPVVVNVLDDLTDPHASQHTILHLLTALRGLHRQRWVDDDPHSLPTRRLRWADGLVVEVKDVTLGGVAPWRACISCPVRSQCREGIFAWRLSHTGLLRPCLDREDISINLMSAYRVGRRRAVAAAWRCFALGLTRAARRSA